MEKIIFENGTKISDAKVTIDQQDYAVQPAEYEGNTPLSAEVLNMMQDNIEDGINQAQQDILDDMSKDYVGTNIVADTKEGYGTVHKLYGGQGVASDVNLFDEVFRQGLHTDTTTANRIASQNSMKSESGKSYILSTNLPSNYKWKIMNNNTNEISNVNVINDTSYSSNSSVIVNCTANGYLKILIAKNDDSNITIAEISKYYFKVQQGIVATPYSSYGKGTVEIISKNGEQQESKIVETKPLAEGDVLDVNTKIKQYDGTTTIYERSGAKLDLTLTNNKAIAEVNEDNKRLEDKIETITNYSTEEKCIGTWIDGRSVYEKVATLKEYTIPADKNEVVVTDISNCEICFVQEYYIECASSPTSPAVFKNMYNIYETDNSYFRVRGFNNNLLIQTDKFKYIKIAYIKIRYIKY